MRWCNRTYLKSCSANKNTDIYRWYNGGITTNDWLIWNSQTKTIFTQTPSLINNSTTWAKWNITHEASNIIINEPVNVRVEITQAPHNIMRGEEQRRREIENQRLLRDNYAANEERRDAKEKAEKLLQSALTGEQKAELKDKGFFHCRSKIGSLYRIYRGSHGNVIRIGDNGKHIERLCIQPHYVPEGDCMLAQKLHIEHNEDEFRRTANITLLN